MAAAVAKPPDEGIGGMPKEISPGLPSVPSRYFIRVANTLLVSFIRVVNTLLVSFIRVVNIKHQYINSSPLLYHYIIIFTNYNLFFERCRSVVPDSSVELYG
jgi:hypothetical protein